MATNKMKPRKFHLFDFPENIYVDIDKDFRTNLFNKALSRVGSKAALARYLKEGRMRINFWMQGYRIMYKRKYPEFIPFRVFKKLSNLLNISEKEIEKKVIAYKSRGSRYYIKNPKFPLVESEAIARILAHYIGDGCVSIRSSYYCNKQKGLCMQLKKDLGLFGDVHTSLGYIPNKKQYHLHVLKIVPTILKHLYKIDFGTFNSRIPKSFFKLPRSFTSEFLKAFIDDEGNLSNEQIRIFSANLNLLKDLMGLIKLKFSLMKMAIFGGEKRCYNLIIYTGSLDYFIKLIGYPYHLVKRAKLESYLERIRYRKSLNGKRTKRYETKSKILDYIRSNVPCEIYDLSRDLKITEHVIREHLKALENSRLIEGFRESNNGPKIWRIKNGIREFKQ